MNVRNVEWFDVIVMGGGPGGTTAATLVALQGHRVLLLEKERFPRHQIGESLLPTTIHGICGMLGARNEVMRAGFTKKLGGSFLWGSNPQPWNFSFGQSPSLTALGLTHAYQVERARFDEILLRNASRRGVDVRESHTAVSILTENERACGVSFIDDQGHERTARSHFIVDASGHRGGFHAETGERIYSEFFRNVAVYAYFEGAMRLPPPREGNILSSAFSHGWFWFIPLSSTLTSVGAVIDRAHYDSIKNDHGGNEQLLREMIRACPPVAQLLGNAQRVTGGLYGEVRVRMDYSYDSASFWRPGLVRIGDAACFIDPLFSSGVHLATYAALQAARAINTVLKGNAVETRYPIEEARCFTEFEHRYRKEYRHFFDLVSAFYELHVDENSYFWVARKILATEHRETSPEAFLRLVAGASQAAHDFHPEVSDTTAEEAFRAFLRATEDEKKHVASLAFHGHRDEIEQPLLAGGLVPSLDGFHWREPNEPSDRKENRQ